MPATTDELRARALRLLARREYSRQELAAKLRSKPASRPTTRRARTLADEFAPSPYTDEILTLPSENDINALLDDLERQRLLSDNRYAEMRAHLRAPRYGNNRLQQELAQKGIDRETIAAVLAEQPDELARCRELWLKKFGHPPGDMNERMKQTRHLASRGFAMRVIQQVLRCPDHCANDLSPP